jgi:hypothetical protein
MEESTALAAAANVIAFAEGHPSGNSELTPTNVAG